MPRKSDIAKKSKFLFAHLRLGGLKKSITVSSLESGMIVEAVYTSDSKSGGGDRYMLLILNPSKSGKVHALSLGDISVNSFNVLVKEFGVSLNGTFNDKGFKAKGLHLEESPQAVYNDLDSKFKKNSPFSGSYRTLFKGGFKKLLLCDYEFDETIVNRDLPRLEIEKKLESLNPKDDLAKKLTEEMNQLPENKILRPN